MPPKTGGDQSYPGGRFRGVKAPAQKSVSSQTPPQGYLILAVKKYPPLVTLSRKTLPETLVLKKNRRGNLPLNHFHIGAGDKGPPSPFELHF